MSIAVLIGLIGGIAGALATYLIAIRRLSGQVKTTDAEALWREAAELRQSYMATAEVLRAEITQCRERISALEQDNNRLHDENHRLVQRVEELTRENERLRLEIDRFKREIVPDV